MIKIEEGKFYKTRDGQRVGPMAKTSWNDFMFHGFANGDQRIFRENGDHDFNNRGLDLISEWQEGPIREVRRREIVPGVYGIVGTGADGSVSVYHDGPPSPEQLREAAHLFNQLAEVLEEQG